MDLLNILTSRGFSPRRISTNNGGEFASPCPVCGDGGKGTKSDRFHIWPSRESGGLGTGRFWCRQCGISGDNIAFLQKIDRLSFPDACNQLGIILPKQSSSRSSRYRQPPQLPPAEYDWQPRTYPEPNPTWKEKAGQLLTDCKKRLATMPEAIAWLERRGLDRSMMDRFQLGYNQSSKGGDRYRPRKSWGLKPKMQGGKEKKLWIPKGWVIPSFNQAGELVQLRIRRTEEDIKRFAGGIKYLPIDGSSSATMVLFPEAEVFITLESGFDAILLAGLMGGKIGTVTSWNSSARPDARTHAILKNSAMILGGLDYDQGGDREQRWWRSQYRQYRRLPALPGGAKDPGDAHSAGVDLRQWVISGMPTGLKLKLGYSKVARMLQSKPEPDQSQPEQHPQKQTPQVVEMKLSNGKVIYLTNDQARWQELARQAKPVFSQHELRRLQEATARMNPDERLAAAMQAIEIKEVLGGYVRAGRTLTGDE